MVQLDGAGTSQTARVVIVGATNRYFAVFVVVHFLVVSFVVSICV